MTDAQKAAMRTVLDADLNWSIEQALTNVTTMFGAQEKARAIVTHMTDDAWRNDLIDKLSNAADGAA